MQISMINDKDGNGKKLMTKFPMKGIDPNFFMVASCNSSTADWIIDLYGPQYPASLLDEAQFSIKATIPDAIYETEEEKVDVVMKIGELEFVPDNQSIKNGSLLEWDFRVHKLCESHKELMKIRSVFVYLKQGPRVVKWWKGRLSDFNEKTQSQFISLKSNICVNEGESQLDLGIVRLFLSYKDIGFLLVQRVV